MKESIGANLEMMNLLKVKQCISKLWKPNDRQFLEDVMASYELLEKVLVETSNPVQIEGLQIGKLKLHLISRIMNEHRRQVQNGQAFYHEELEGTFSRKTPNHINVTIGLAISPEPDGYPIHPTRKIG